LVSIGATLGKVSFYRDRASANQQINIISFFNDSCNPLFGYYFLVGNKEMITLEADFTTLPILNQSKTKNLLIAVPPIEEQHLIVRHIETECARIDAKKAGTEKLIELLTEYRTALISEVVTGKVKVAE
jgi:type I restriction enzyme, S subunit